MLHPLPKDLALADVMSALKNIKTDPAEVLHAGWHVVGYVAHLFHENHEGLHSAAATNPAVAALLADIEATAPDLPKKGAKGNAAIDFNQIKAWGVKVLKLLLMILDDSPIEYG